MDTDTFDIQELVQRSGVPRRTVYFYVQQGILPPPEGAGLAARYSADHLNRLRLIPVLRAQGLRLDEIRKKFETMAAADMEKLLAEAEAIPAALPAPAPRPAAAETEPSYTAARFVHYTFPDGVIIAAPVGLPGPEETRLNELLDAARRIYGPSAAPGASKNGGDPSTHA